MSGCQVNLAASAEPSDFPRDRFAVATAQSRIDHQRGPVADDNADVRYLADSGVRNRIGVRTQLRGGVLRHERRAPGATLGHNGRSEYEAGNDECDSRSHTTVW